MKERLYLYMMIISALSIVFPYENKFSYDNNKVSLSHSPEFTEISGGYTRLSKMGEGFTTEDGMPELPQFFTYYQLDPSKTYEFQLEVLESYTIEDITIMPHQSMDKWEIDVVSIINEEVYNSYSAFPEQNMVISDRMQGRGIEFVGINVIPYAYYPKYHKLEVYNSIDIHVIETGDKLDNQLHQPKRSHIFDEYYKDLIVNFEYSDRPDDYQASAILYIGGGSSLNNSNVQDLIEWRHKQGYIVYTASESDVGGSSASTSEIKNYISDAYYNWDNPPELVGLIGDTGGSYSLPNYDHNWSGYNGATDFDYTQLDGNDMIPEVFIGRISGSDSQVSNIINKTLHYEKADHVPDVWFNGAALAGDPDESGNSTIYTNQYIENIMINHGMNRVQTDYDGSGVQTFMEAQFNAGVMYYNYRGWYYGYGSYPTNDIDNGYETPFVTTITCGTGDYNGTASSEEFVWLGSENDPKGAVAAVGMATTGTHTMYNNIVDMGIYEGIFVKKLWYAGASVSNGHAAIVATYPNPNSAANAAEAFSKWSNLIGDPALHLWTNEPTDFAIDYLDAIPLGTTTMDINVFDEDGNAVEGARVTLLMGDDIIFTTGLTDEYGVITLNWSAVQSGIMSIMAIKRDFRPFESTIEIQESAGAAIAPSGGEIYVEAGETTEFNISLHNYGMTSAQEVVAELSSPSDHVTINQNIVNFGFIASGSSVSKYFPVYIHEIAHDMEDLKFKLTIRDGEENIWISHIPVVVSSSHLIITEYNGEIMSGENTDFSISLNNIGSRPAENIMVELLPYENYLSINSGLSLIDHLSDGGFTTLDRFDIDFSNNIINGTILPMEFIFTSNDGSSRMEIINITVGEVRETDPLGPDLYGYYIYDMTDVEYSSVPEYNWIEIADDSNQLNITDSGNGNCSSSSYSCSSTVKDLPFIFTFYGVDYDKIVINTNGWISFGDFEMYSFRNYPIPGAGGPSPMVAAFWDDLKTGSSGYVYYYATETEVIIQWDYIRTHDNGSRETFEIILYNKEFGIPTSTGDSEIKIQYEEFNNTSDGNYSGYYPYHGCYSTVGIESHLGDMGLEYTFNNSYPEAAFPLQNGSALFITTRLEDETVAGDINGDGNLNVLDVVTLVNLVLSGGVNPAADINGDGNVNILDVVTLVNMVLDN